VSTAGSSCAEAGTVCRVEAGHCARRRRGRWWRGGGVREAVGQKEVVVAEVAVRVAPPLQ
jgi:hypothetical protein